MMIFILMISVFIVLVLILINLFLSMHKTLDREKASPFECGFDSKSSSRVPFSLHFYLLALIFLIFDVEITLLVPMPLAFGLVNLKMLVLMTIFFVLILVVGTIYEWFEGSLDWIK